jgi:cyclic pyranopterin phosphate synthase
MTEKLVDPFGREINYLRVSVTDRCDFRCTYCMPKTMTFLPRAQILSLEEIAFISRAFVELGVSKIRLTGGEPLVRANVMDLFSDLGKLKGLDELVVTTNGSRLASYAKSLKESGVKRLNVSLDTLDAARFRDITRVGRLSDVLEGLQVAKKQGFERIKLNCVAMFGENDQDIVDLVDFSLEQGFDISFIEEMPLGDIDHDGHGHLRADTQFSSSHVLNLISERHTLLPSTENTGGPSRYHKIAGENIRVGLISPNSNNFCESCNRVRLTVEGRLLLCLGHENSVDLKTVVRTHPGDIERLKATIVAALVNKPERHYFDVEGDTQVVRFMNMTGG